MPGIIENATATGAGSWVDARHFGRGYGVQVLGNTTSGAGSAVVQIEVSNDGVNAIIAGSVSLTLGTSVTDDGMTIDALWKFIRANVISITGTGAKVSAII